MAASSHRRRLRDWAGKLSVRLYLVAFGSTIVAMLAIAYEGTGLVQRLLESRQNEHASTVCLLVASALEAEGQRLPALLAFLTDDEGFREAARLALETGSGERLKSYALQAVPRLGVDALEIEGGNGRVLAFTDASISGGKSEREKALLRTALAGGSPPSEYVVRDGEVFLFVVHSGRLGHGRLGRAALGAWVRLNPDWVRRMGSLHGMDIVLAEGQRPLVSALEGPVTVSDPDRGGSHRVESRGRRLRMQGLLLPGGRARLLAGYDLAAGERAIAEARWLIARIALFSMLFMSFAIFATVLRVDAWLGELVAAARRIEESGPEAFKPPSATNLPTEFRLLWGAFARMAEAMVARRHDLERAHERIVQSERMASVGTLAAGLAHEINNPLGVILGFAQAAAREVPEDGRLALPLRSIEREALRCRSLVRDLLVFSRRGGAVHEPFQLNDAVRGTLNIIAPQAKLKRVETRLELEELPLVPGDRERIQQVIVNLCNNAVDAMPEGGTLTVATSVCEGCALLEVTDDGEGIPSEVIGKIFDPFFTTKPVGKGTGLGLSLVYEIVQKHKGTISVRSRPKGGTTFTVKLPLSPAGACQTIPT